MTPLAWWVQGYLAHKKRTPPWDYHRALGTGLLQGPRGGRFLMSEVPLYEGGCGEKTHKPNPPNNSTPHPKF